MERKLRAGPLVGLVLVVGLILPAASGPASAQGAARGAICDGISALADEGVYIRCRADEGCPGALACGRRDFECRSCAGNGVCQLGECLCSSGWQGDDCSIPARLESPLVDG